MVILISRAARGGRRFGARGRDQFTPAPGPPTARLNRPGRLALGVPRRPAGRHHDPRSDVVDLSANAPVMRCARRPPPEVRSWRLMTDAEALERLHATRASDLADGQLQRRSDSTSADRSHARRRARRCRGALGAGPVFRQGEPGKFNTITTRVETFETVASYRGPWAPRPALHTAGERLL